MPVVHPPHVPLCCVLISLSVLSQEPGAPSALVLLDASCISFSYLLRSTYKITHEHIPFTPLHFRSFYYFYLVTNPAYRSLQYHKAEKNENKNKKKQKKKKGFDYAFL
jgi:hypothetical protein